MLKLIPKSKVQDLIIVYLIWVSGSLFVYMTGAGLFVYNIVVLLATLIFLLYKNTVSSKKVLIQGLIAGFFAEMLIDSFGIRSHAWVSPTIFPFTIFGLVVENYLWCMLFVAVVLAFYEHFFDTKKTKKLPPVYKYWILFLGSIGVIIPVVFYADLVSVFVVNYFYAILMLVLIALDLLGLWKQRTITLKAFWLSVLVLPLAFVHEITSLEFKHWIFERGYHLLYVPILKFQVPIEEIVFYVAAPVMLILFYEIFLDNSKS